MGEPRVAPRIVVATECAVGSGAEGTRRTYRTAHVSIGDGRKAAVAHRASETSGGVASRRARHTRAAAAVGRGASARASTSGERSRRPCRENEEEGNEDTERRIR